MLNDLSALEAHQKHLRSQETEEGRRNPEGELHFRNCENGCPAMDWFRTTQTFKPGGDVEVFAESCRGCDLKAAPGQGAIAVLGLTLFPVESLSPDLPGSVVQGLMWLDRRRRVF